MVVERIRRFGVSVMVAVSAPTALAVRACEAADITLIARRAKTGLKYSPIRTASPGTVWRNVPRLAQNGQSVRR